MYAHLLGIMARLREDFADSLPDAASKPPVAGQSRQNRRRRSDTD
jgi:hypothetical protein